MRFLLWIRCEETSTNFLFALRMCAQKKKEFISQFFLAQSATISLLPSELDLNGKTCGILLKKHLYDLKAARVHGGVEL